MQALLFISAILIVTILFITACAQSNDGDVAAQWIAEMDARPASEQVPNWPEIRALMQRKAPGVGQPAPDLALRHRDSDEIVRLSSFRGHKPVVLIFGSWT